MIQIFKFYYYLLETLTSKLLKLNLSEFSLLTYWKSPTIRFPIEPQLPDDDNRFSSYIIPFHKDNWMEIGKHLHKNDRAFVEFTSQLNDVKNDEFLLLKVYGALLSEGWTYPNQLSKFLKACQNLDSNSRLRALIVEQLYLGVYSIRNKSSVRFSLMRYIPGELCSSEDFPKWWKQNREKAKIAFFRDVYEPALEAIECGYYHWDICSENLICDKTNFKFYILDWESLIDIDLPEQLENFVSQNAKNLGFDTSVSTKVAISLCENLLVSCLYIWEGYEKQGGKWAEQIFKLFVKIIPIVVLDSDNVLFSESKLVYDNIMLQCIQLVSNF